MPTKRRTAGWAACALAVSLLAPVSVVPGFADSAPREMAAIEATAPLDDPSPSREAVRAAITIALQKAARGAIAMGLPWVHVQSAYVRPGYVTVQVLATAAPSDQADEPPDAPHGDSGKPGVEPGSDEGPSRIRI